ncbi:iron ABC transporter ATP-binding protein [Siminovitchia terrae]|uniref:ABC transporter ATP-binding protein n=1 Tax=Siminovitchia terrae TaxID=1914933 RepID=A0A429XE76_SIMTE|nr:ABC transporter ATP-binding protein [Siminovitchia terrae]RST61621.1 ABC transporter ATP-binding protein [Siminovitchia terrae]GIN92384.1 iron ABC transporter ATP-binding protein [Siminovitchia terrae]GIN97224.1 iron ABC transporter ATP-binding protein [Siminovitchia terrae]
MEIKDITYSYDKKTNHLENISSKIDQHKITTIIGPNGSGKSTLLGILANSYAPNKGQVMIDGKQLHQIKPKELAKKIAIVHQQNSAPADMTVEKLTSYGRLPYKSIFSNQTPDDQQAVEWALQKTNLIAKKTKMISELSGGERQRAWIAMTLAQSTPYLFLDEPTTYLDIYYQYEILELVKQLNSENGLTIVMVLHDINQAIRYSDTIMVMKDGKLIKKGTPEQVVTSELIQEIYGVQAVVKMDEESGLYILPLGTQ